MLKFRRDRRAKLQLQKAVMAAKKELLALPQNPKPNTNTSKHDNATIDKP